jgi:hypothetical protein
MQVASAVLAIPAAFIWLAVVVAASIIYRRRAGKPVIPRAPADAVFVEKGCSGNSQRNVLTQLGGASNCLLVYVADQKIHVVPQFPFNLLFLPEIWGLETTADVSKVSVSAPTRSLGRVSVLLTVHEPHPKTFRIWLRDAVGLQQALSQGPHIEPARHSGAQSPKPKPSIRTLLFRGFMIIWGSFALIAGGSGLKEDFASRHRGVATTGTVVSHTAEVGAKDDRAVLEYSVDGRPYRLTSLKGTGFYHLGETEKVFYQEDRPSNGREAAYLPFDLFWLVAGVVALSLGTLFGAIRLGVQRALKV